MVWQTLNRIAGVDQTCDFVKVSKAPNQPFNFLPVFLIFPLFSNIYIIYAGWFHEDAVPWQQFRCSVRNRGHLPCPRCCMKIYIHKDLFFNLIILLCIYFFYLTFVVPFICSSFFQVGCYQEIYRVLKPGQCFAAYEWCMTDSFDPNNQEHQQIKVIDHRNASKTISYFIFIIFSSWCLALNAKFPICRQKSN